MNVDRQGKRAKALEVIFTATQRQFMEFLRGSSRGWGLGIAAWESIQV
jgi:hypothetical protein